MESDENILKHIQNVELLILKDFIDICEENELQYYLFWGSEIGAVRHQGFIPWDDDIDVIMFREDYEKFLKVMEAKKSEKYTVFDCRYNEEYFFQFARLSLNGTYWSEFWDNQVSFDLGIHIDIFILDKLPTNKIKQFLYIKYCRICCQLQAISAINVEQGSKMLTVILSILHSILNIVGLKPRFFQKRMVKLFRRYENEDSKLFADLTLDRQLIFKLKDFKPAKKVLFESMEVTIPNNQNATVGAYYGDYMQLPPEEEQVGHVSTKIDFGNY